MCGSGPEVPYDVQLVAGNGAGCGKVSISQVFFTREGGTATYCLLLTMSEIMHLLQLQRVLLMM